MQPHLTYAGHLRALLILGLPIVGSQLAQMSLHTTDIVMMGWYGVEPLAALVLGTSVWFLMFIFGTGFGNAVLPMVASASANGGDTEVRRVTRMALWLSMLWATAVLPVMWFSEPILLAIGQKPPIAAMAQQFLRIACFGMFPALAVVTLRSFLVALERTQVVLWITVAGFFVNAGLVWALVFGHWGAPELGVQGAALASVFTQLLSMLATMAYAGLFGPLRRFRLFIRFWKPDWTAFGRVWRLGWPIGLTALFEAGMFIAAAVMMGWLGALPLAAHGIAMQAAAIGFMVHLGISQALTVRTGQAMALHDMAGMRDGAYAGIVLSVAVAIAVVAAMLLFAVPIIGLFVSDSDPQRAGLMTIGVQLMAMGALFHFADAMQVFALGLLRGVQDTKTPMLIASVSYWVIGIPCSYLLGFVFDVGAVGVWLGLVAGLTVAAGLLMARFWGRSIHVARSAAPPQFQNQPAGA